MAEKIIYTEEEIIKQLKDHYKRNGKITKNSFASDKTVCSAVTVRKKFGSWKKARSVMKKYRSTLPGFKEYPNCFIIKKMKVNKDNYYFL